MRKILLVLLALGVGACASPMTPTDSDKDGVLDSQDNCPEISNPSQTDGNGDGIGDLCEPIVGCGDGVCDPEGGECDVFVYCLKDCTKSRCLGLPENATCGDGFCDPLAGECSDFGRCSKDCDKPMFEEDFACFPQTCGNGVCEPWEDDPLDEKTFCIFDCTCQVNLVAGDCQFPLDCAGNPGTLCRPTHFPEGFFETFAAFIQAYIQIPCHCTTCGNGALDPEEGCDPSAGFEIGVQACIDTGRGCDELSCECKFFAEVNCDDGLDDDGNGFTDCLDPNCESEPICSGAI